MYKSILILGSPVRSEHRHVMLDDMLHMSWIGKELFNRLRHCHSQGFHSRSTSGDSPPCSKAFKPILIRRGAGIERPLTSASPVDSAGSSSMSWRLSISEARTIKCWSSGFFSRITMSVLHGLVTSGSSLLGL